MVCHYSAEMLSERPGLLNPYIKSSDFFFFLLGDCSAGKTFVFCSVIKLLPWRGIVLLERSRASGNTQWVDACYDRGSIALFV